MEPRTRSKVAKSLREGARSALGTDEGVNESARAGLLSSLWPARSGGV